MATESGSGPSSGRATLLTVDQINSDHVTEVVLFAGRFPSKTYLFVFILFADCH